MSVPSRSLHVVSFYEGTLYKPSGDPSYVLTLLRHRSGAVTELRILISISGIVGKRFSL